jgi:hypothetical protein
MERNLLKMKLFQNVKNEGVGRGINRNIKYVTYTVELRIP